jgi:hypothetical protein
MPKKRTQVSSSAPLRSPEAWLFALLIFSYAYFFGGSGWNQNATFDLTRSIVERHELQLRGLAANTADVSFHGGRIYSNKAPGLSFAAAVPYALIHAIAGPPRDATALTIDLYLCSVATCGLSGALIGVLLFRHAQRKGLLTRDAFAVGLIAGLGTPIFAYSTMLFAHVPSALFVLVAYLERDRPLRCGAALGAATILNYAAIVVAAVFLFSLVRKPRQLALLAAGGAPFALALAVYQVAAFGSPFTTSIATTNPSFLEQGALLGILHAPRLEALWGLTFSPYRGLFFLAPVLLLALPALREPLIAGSCAAMLLLNACFNGWHGGYTIGPRYLVVIIPLLVVAAIETIDLRRVALILGALSIALNLAATAVDPQPPDSVRNPIGHYAIPALLFGNADVAEAPWIGAFYTGHTSTNRVAADELLPFQHHRPGSRENEWASFNAGELLFGPGSAASLLPWLLVLGATAVSASLRDRRPSSSTTPDTRTARSRSA